jgi:fructose-bisphosphate aldolase class 1
VSTIDSGKTAQAHDGRGLVAADEPVPAATRRLAALMIESTLESRRAYQEILFTTPGVSDFISASWMRRGDCSRCDSVATLGRYSPSMESESVVV